MRALVVEPGPAFSVADVHRGIVTGLQAQGVETVSFNLGDRLNFYTAARIGERVLPYEDACRLACQGLRAACWDFGPDLVVITSSFFVPPETFASIRRRGTHVVAWFTEAPYEDDRQVPIAAHADSVVVNDPQNLDRYRAVNERSWYIPHSYDPQVHHPHSRSNVHPFCFVGTGYPSRIAFLEQADLPDGSVLAGNWKEVADTSPLAPYLLHERGECVDNTDTADLYRASTTSLNLYRREAMADGLEHGWAMGPREVELAACGTWFARDPRGEGDEVLSMLPTVTTPAEAGDAIRWALTHPDQREAATQAARAAVADRTFASAAAALLAHIS